LHRESRTSRNLQGVRLCASLYPTEKIDAFDKLEFESEFQALSKGGAISYIEVPNLRQNIPAVVSVIQFIYEHIMYSEARRTSGSSICGEHGIPE